MSLLKPPKPPGGADTPFCPTGCSAPVAAFTHKGNFKLRLYIRPFLPGALVCVCLSLYPEPSFPAFLESAHLGLLPQIWLKLESICYIVMMGRKSG